MRPPPRPTLFPYTTLFRSVMASPTMYAPLTLLQCCPTSSGGAAAVVASVRFVREHGLGARAVEILARSEEHTSELQSHVNLVCRLLLAKKKTNHSSEIVDL